MHTVFALLCFVVVIHWLIFPYPSGLLHWHCGNLTIAPVPAKQHWWIWINTSCEFIMNDCITTTKQSTTKPCAYVLGYTVTNQCFDNFEKLGINRKEEVTPPWALFQYSIRRFIAKSRKVSKMRDLYFEFSDRSENWQAPQQHCCRSAGQNFKAMR